MCKVYLRAHKADLLKHSKTGTHIRKFKALHPNDHHQSTLNTHIVIQSNEEKKNDITLAVFIATHTSLRSIDHLGEILKNIGKQSKCSMQNLRLHRTKCSALIKHVIGPSLLEGLKKRLSDVPFSIIVDESTDCSVLKFLSIYIKFFDVHRSEVCTEFSALIPVESVTAKDLFEVVKNFLVKDMGLSLANMLGIGTDGANNLCGKNNSLYTLLKQEIPQLQLVRCICHSINNAVSSAADEMPACVEFLCREVYNWFSHSSQRRIQYKRLFDILNGNDKVFHNFVQPSNTRWLAKFNAVNIIIENWEELQVHFNTVVNKEKCYTSRLLNDMLKANINYLSLLIVRPILCQTNKLNLLFQKSNIDLGDAYKDVCCLIYFLGAKIFKPSFVNQNDVNTFIENFDNPVAFVQPHDCDFGVDYNRALGTHTVDDSDKKTLEFKCMGYIKKLLGEVIRRLPDHIDLFKKIGVFAPKICLNPVTRCKFSKLPFLYLISQNKLYEVENQYNVLLTVSWKELLKEDVLEKSYLFWPEIYKFKNSGGEFPFKDLAKYVLQILCLPSSNAVVERGFSIMNCIKTKARNKLGVEMLNSLMRIRLHLFSQGLCCKQFQITREMLNKCNTTSMYQNQTSSERQTDSQTETDEEVIHLFSEVEFPCLSM